MDVAKKAKVEQFAIIGLLMLFALILAGSLKKSGMFRGKQPAEPEKIIQGTMPEMIQKARQEVGLTDGPQVTTPEPQQNPSPSLLQYKYMASDKRDPLENLFPKPEQPKEAIPEVESEVVEENLPPKIPPLLVEGMIWGGNRPQAIINSKVYDVGDMVEGGKIVSIDTNGVKIDFNGYIINLDANSSKAKDSAN
jgi:hypothetical protein